jgi:hypothetical protein
VTAEARSAEEQLVIAVRSSSLSDEAQYHVLGLIRIMFKAHTSQ